MSIQWMGAGVVKCPCPGCSKMVDYKALHPSAELPRVVRTLCRALHPVELEFTVFGQDPTARCMMRTPAK